MNSSELTQQAYGFSYQNFARDKKISKSAFLLTSEAVVKLHYIQFNFLWYTVVIKIILNRYIYMVQNKSHISVIIGLFPTFIPTDNHYYQYIMYSSRVSFCKYKYDFLSFPVPWYPGIEQFNWVAA